MIPSALLFSDKTVQRGHRFFFFQGEQTDVPPGMALVGDLLSHQDATKLLHCQYLSEPTAVVMDTMRNVQLIKLQINKSQNH